MFDIEKKLSPPSVHEEQLLLQVQRNGLVARLNEKIPRVVHGRMLIYPVSKIPEKLLTETKKVAVKARMEEKSVKEKQ